MPRVTACVSCQGHDEQEHLRRRVKADMRCRCPRSEALAWLSATLSRPLDFRQALFTRCEAPSTPDVISPPQLATHATSSCRSGWCLINRVAGSLAPASTAAPGSTPALDSLCPGWTFAELYLNIFAGRMGPGCSANVGKKARRQKVGYQTPPCSISWIVDRSLQLYTQCVIVGLKSTVLSEQEPPGLGHHTIY